MMVWFKRIDGRWCFPALLCSLMLGLWLSGWPVPDAQALEGRVLRVLPQQGSFCVAPFMDVLEDASGHLGIRHIIRGEYSGRFSAHSEPAFNFGVTSSVFWLRFKVGINETVNGPATQNRILDLGEAFKGRVRWALYDMQGRRIGSSGSGGGKNYFAVIPITRLPRYYYLNVASTTSLLIRPRLFGVSAYFGDVRRMECFWGLLYGIILAVGIYNFLLYFSFKDRSYLWYVFHLFLGGLYFAGINGLTGDILFKGRPELLGMINRSFLGMMTATIALFTRSFLMTRLKAPKTDKLIIGLFVFACALSLMNLISQARAVVTALVATGIVVPLIMIAASRNAFKAGFGPARIFMAAWGIFVVGVLSFAMTAGGIIPYHPVGIMGFQFGSATAAILLSFALGRRIKTLQDERTSFQQSMKRLTMILDSINSGVFLIERDTKNVREINLAAEKILGRPRDRIIGRPYRQLFADGIEAPGPDADKGELDVSLEDRLVNHLGQEVPVLKRAKLIDLDGHRLILESFVDISELRQAQEAVRKSETKYRSLFESSRDAVMLLDQYRFVDCNPATLNMFGCRRPEEFIGKTPSDFSPEYQPSGEASSDLALRHINEALHRGSLFFEWDHIRSDGEVFPAEVMLGGVEVEDRVILQALIRDITKRKALEKKLRHMASTDPLTGADNRRSFMEKAGYELMRSHRYHHPFACLMMDIDHFKRINDTHGHPVGDEVLKALVSRSRKLLRETDLFGRLGGEEFAAILPETNPDTAVTVCERLRTQLSAIRVPADQGRIRFTVSMGLALLEGEGEDLAAIMKRSDDALYKAKTSGRNRLVVSGASTNF